ncbi:MAG: TIGR01777 family oxidoreductase [Planctomycetota bacterium]|jgi:uncharacterized protein (TIGR01777 family)
MRIFITGATGLVGSRLVEDRLERGDEVHALSRSAARARAKFDDRVTVVEGDPATAGPWQESIDGVDAVVHLAGAGVADRRWTKHYKAVMRASRVEGSRRLVEAIERASSPPPTLVAASAVGWYGETGAREVNESAPAGEGFLARLCADWEQATGAVTAARVVHLRIGVVLDERGGVIGRLRRPFSLGLGGRLGSGRQYMPWIHWSDLVALIDRGLTDATLSGPINAVAPEAITNRTFTQSLAKALGRPAILPAPGFGLRLILGEMAGTLLMSQRIEPAVALAAGFEFRYPALDAAIAEVVSKA